MAQGDLTLFEEFAVQMGTSEHVFGTDVIKVALITTIPTAADTTPTLSDYTEVVGTGYTAGGEEITNDTYVEAAGVATFNGDNITWSQNALGPGTVKAALLYNDTHASDMAFAYVDMTADGSTAISLINGDISITWNGSGIFTTTV